MLKENQVLGATRTICSPHHSGSPISLPEVRKEHSLGVEAGNLAGAGTKSASLSRLPLQDQHSSMTPQIISLDIPSAALTAVTIRKITEQGRDSRSTLFKDHINTLM